jgi:hypothetical protein
MPKKKKHKPLHSPTTKEGALARVRAFILDSQAKNGNEIALALGCPPISDEVLEREEEESDLRLEEITYLAPILYSYSEMLVEGSLAYQRSLKKEEFMALDEAVWHETKRMMEQISRAVLVGAISQLVDMGHLRVSKRQAKLKKKDV